MVKQKRKDSEKEKSRGECKKAKARSGKNSK